IVGLHPSGTPPPRPARWLGRRVAANSGGAGAGAFCGRRMPPRPPAIAPVAHAAAIHAGVVIGVRTVDAVVDIIVGIGPEVVVGIRPVNVIEQVVIGVRPEHRSEPAEYEPAEPRRPGRTREPALESRLWELRLQRHVGDGAVAKHPTTGIAHPCRRTPHGPRRTGCPLRRGAMPRRQHAANGYLPPNGTQYARRRCASCRYGPG